MMRDVLQNTTRPFKIYMADAAAPTAAKTDLTQADITVYLSKSGAAEVTIMPTIVNRGHGMYEATLLAAHRDTLGDSSLVFTAAGAVDFIRIESVIAADAHLAAFGANTTSPAVPGAAMTLEAGERDTLAGVVDARILDAGDASDVIASIVTRINNTNVSEVALVAAIRDDIERAGGSVALIQAALSDVATDVLNLPDEAEIAAEVESVQAAAHGAGSWLSGSSGSVQVSGFDAAALLQLVEDDTGRTTAVDGSVARIAQGSAADITAELQTIIAQTSLITSTKVEVVSPVSKGGDVTLYRGSDYRVRSGTAIEIPVSDAGGVLHATLIDTEQIESIIFGAGEVSSANCVVGTISRDDLDFADNVLTISVEITAEQIQSQAACLDYHIKAIAPVVDGETRGDEVVKIEGDCEVRSERATP